jgi:hypothetical protein
MVAEWADWATGVVGDWPVDPREAVVDRAALAESVARAEWSQGTRS